MNSKDVILVLALKKLQERIDVLETRQVVRGKRGATGSPGKDFDFDENHDRIRSLVLECVPKLSDLTESQIELFRGPPGADGDGFVFSEHREGILEACRQAIQEVREDLRLKLSDLSESDIEALRGPGGGEGKRGPRGSRGKDFDISEHEQRFKDLAKEFAIKFSDLTSEELESLRGPRGREGEPGRDGKDGLDFVFDEHRPFFESLRPKFSDYTQEELGQLKLKFSDLSEVEKESLGLKFENLSEQQISSLRGGRGPRGQKGSPGEPGQRGGRGPRGVPGVPGIVGRQGREGENGRDGRDGLDAPYIVEIRVEDVRFGVVRFAFEFSDGSVIRTDDVFLPRNSFYAPAGGGGGADIDLILSGLNVTDELAVLLDHSGNVLTGVA